ncbi:MAG: glycosyltransferase [Planctomycetia bacterium]|nr:glycosyltransferase [Planctomycetia bacterium]
MGTTCLITNYNYARFLGDALDSVLAQSVPFDEVIVVDDGSTDASTEILAKIRARHPAIKLVAKDNGGQLSSFNEGFARATGDIVFFLDSDDVYEPNYVAQALKVYSRHPSCGFVACGLRQFGQSDAVKLAYPGDRDLGHSVILASFLRAWIGAPTSCLSMRREVLEKILPLPFREDWRTRADDCLVFGASLAGARKYYLAQPLVRYRVHDDNKFCRSVPDEGAVYRRRLAINRLFEHLERKLCYNVPRLADFPHREFCTIAQPTFRQLAQYARIALGSRVSLARRFACIGAMTGHYLRTRAARHSDAAALPTASPPNSTTTIAPHSARLRGTFTVRA